MTTSEHEQLINAHWDGYTGPLLEHAGVPHQFIPLLTFIYRTAWHHGAKHEKESQQEKGVSCLPPS